MGYFYLQPEISLQYNLFLNSNLLGWLQDSSGKQCSHDRKKKIIK